MNKLNDKEINTLKLFKDFTGCTVEEDIAIKYL